MTGHTVDIDAFQLAAEPFRREVFAHCYRMTGSVHDAEDLAQDAYLRAWRSFHRFEGRSSVRTWLYRIATNVCLTALDRRRRRVLPSGLGAPSSDPWAAVASAPDDVQWFEPIADRLVVDEFGDPAEVIATRNSLRLALVAAIQLLPPRQRAALILCDVLAWPAVDAADALGVSRVAVKSLLQRARRRLAEESVIDDDLVVPTDDDARRLLDRYVEAFERSDMAEIERLLAVDAVLEMTGTSTWFAGKAACVPFIAVQAIGTAGDWRLLPLLANGQLACAAYMRGADGDHHPYAIVVIATSTTHLTRISLFNDVTLFDRFGMPLTAPASSALDTGVDSTDSHCSAGVLLGMTRPDS